MPRARVVVAPDKLKGTLGAPQAARALARGVARALPGAEVLERPVADGGEGTLAALLAGGGQELVATVEGPLGAPVAARWGRLPDASAVVETAQAIGLVLVAGRDPLRASSRGAGQLLRAALAAGARRVIVGLGGSATVDGGAGLLEALGARLLDAQGAPLPPGGGALERLARIDPGGLVDLRGVELLVACDVDNPLLGPAGAASAFGPQKGADPAAVARLEQGLARLVARLATDLPNAERPAALEALPGAGAAGGLGAALAALGGRLVLGAELVLDALGLDAALAGAGLALTAEGALDGTTARGKAPWAVLGRARRAGVPCLAVGGRIDPAARATLEGPQGFAALLALSDAPPEPERASDRELGARVGPLLEAAGERAARLALARGWVEGGAP